MSRKFLDDNIELNTTAAAPAATVTETRYPRGHFRLNRGAGVRYVNEGNENAAIWTNWPANRYALYETFKQAPLLTGSLGVASNLDFQLLGTNAANAGSTFNVGGGVTLTTTTTSGDQVIVLPHLSAKQTAWTGTNWNTNSRLVYETNIKTDAAITTMIAWAGLKLTNTNVAATDTDQVYVRYEAGVNSGALQILSSNNGVLTTFNTKITVAVSTSYHIKVIVDVNRVAHVYINGAFQTKTPALKANVNLIPYIAVQTSTTAARVLSVYGQKLSRDLG